MAPRSSRLGSPRKPLVAGAALALGLVAVPSHVDAGINDNTYTAINWGDSAGSNLGRDCGARKGLEGRYRCPAGGPGARNAWGATYYTSDSSICLAAAHAGYLRRNGNSWQAGNVRFRYNPGQASYRSTTNNGVTTGAFGQYECSIKFGAAN